MLGVAQPAALQMSAIKAPRANAQEEATPLIECALTPRGRAVQRPLEGQVLKVQYKRGTWNTAFNRAVLLADMCIEMDASVLIQQQMP